MKAVAAVLLLAISVSGQPLGEAVTKAHHVKPSGESGFNWRQYFALPNTYDERPRHRQVKS